MSNDINQLKVKKIEPKVIKMKFNTITRFTATWCQPCHVYAPIFESTTSEFEEDWNVKSLDIDTEEGHLHAQKYGVRSVPSTLIEKKGEKPQLFTGIILADDLKSLLN